MPRHSSPAAPASFHIARSTISSARHLATRDSGACASKNFPTEFSNRTISSSFMKSGRSISMTDMAPVSSEIGMRETSAARGPVARVLRLDGVARGLPFGVAPFAQFIEIAAGRQRLRAVLAIVSPLSQLQPSDSRNVARFCNSAIVPTRPCGFISRVRAPGSSPGERRLLIPSVGISPGAMALRRMPWRPHSVASDMVIAWIAALLMAEGVTNGPPLRVQVTVIERRRRDDGPRSSACRRPG